MATEKLSAQQRSKIRRLSQPKEHSPDEAGGELNIVPFLDIIMNVLIFVPAARGERRASADDADARSHRARRP